VYDSSAYGFSAAVHSSFTFAADGRVTWILVQQDVRRASLNEPFRKSRDSAETALPYTLRDQELTIGTECPSDARANCAGPMKGRIAGDQLILNPIFSRAAWTFVRAGE
jgi:hypothetical protein